MALGWLGNLGLPQKRAEPDGSSHRGQGLSRDRIRLDFWRKKIGGTLTIGEEGPEKLRRYSRSSERGEHRGSRATQGVQSKKTDSRRTEEPSLLRSRPYPGKTHHNFRLLTTNKLSSSDNVSASS